MSLSIEYEYNAEKNAKLKNERGISFEQIIHCINNGKLLDVIKHHNQEKYIDQQFLVVDVEDYVCLVPFVQTSNRFFLKTIFPSRKHTKLYLKEMLIKNGGNKNE